MQGSEADAVRECAAQVRADIAEMRTLEEARKEAIGQQGASTRFDRMARAAAGAGPSEREQIERALEQIRMRICERAALLADAAEQLAGPAR